MRLVLRHVEKTKAGGWQYRRRVPKDLSAAIHKREFKGKGVLRFTFKKSDEDLVCDLGSRLIDRQSQNRTVAASATAERKVFAHLS